MAEIKVQKLGLKGEVTTFQAHTILDGDTFVNNGDCYLHVKNGGTSSATISIEAKKACSHGYFHNLSITVPAGEDRLIGTFPVDRFNNSDRKVFVKCTGTNITLAVVK